VTTRYGRGRPPRFTDTLRTQYLTAVTAGMYLKAAAAHVGIDPSVPARHARTDTAFGEALQEARAAGKKVRQEATPHGEYRYNHQACRCITCTLKATVARTGRRHTDRDAEPEPGGQIIDLPPQPAQVPPSFSLLIAS